MYLPSLFTLDDAQAWEGMVAWPFAAVVDLALGEAAHLPLLVDPVARRLTGHLARANPLARRLDDTEVLVIFNGPHGYVSPRWYTEPHAHVPTWNYLAIHVHGRLRPLDEAGLRGVLEGLSRANEPPDGWRPDWVPAAWMDGLLPAIAGFSIEVDRVEAKAKLSQNRLPADRAAVVQAFQTAGATGLAAWMRRTGS